MSIYEDWREKIHDEVADLGWALGEGNRQGRMEYEGLEEVGNL